MKIRIIIKMTNQFIIIFEDNLEITNKYIKQDIYLNH